MTIELHTWGPAFGLPSLDVQCLAAIVYLNLCLSRNDWVLIPSSDPTITPVGRLPLLCDGASQITGFNDIVEYLRVRSKGQWHLDGGLNIKDAADCAAFTSFLLSRGQPLLDLSLYVSSENYHSSTQPALARVLSWPSSWFLPHKLRDGARKRSEHLGLSGLDMDAAQEKDSTEEGMTAHIPKALRRPKLTVTSMLGRDVRKTKFRLDALTSDFLEPLSEQLADKEWLLGSRPSTADCLAIAYLSLMQSQPSAPQPWLKDALKKKYTNLDAWIYKTTTKCFGKPPTSMAADMNVATKDLLWQKPQPRGWTQVVNSAMVNVVGAVPWLGSAVAPSEVKCLRHNSGDRIQKRQEALIGVFGQQLLYSQRIGFSTALGAVTGLLWYNRVLSIPNFKGASAPRARSFGEAGAILGLG